jgi:hypothetical protein
MKASKGWAMERKSELESFESKIEPGVSVACRELRIYRPGGALSVIYFPSCESDGKAIAEAENIAQYGYQVDIWQGETRIGRVSGRNAFDFGNYRGPPLSA